MGLYVFVNLNCLCLNSFFKRWGINLKKMQSSNTCYRLISWALHVKLLADKVLKTLLLRYKNSQTTRPRQVASIGYYWSREFHISEESLRIWYKQRIWQIYTPWGSPIRKKRRAMQNNNITAISNMAAMGYPERLYFAQHHWSYHKGYGYWINWKHNKAEARAYILG